MLHDNFPTNIFSISELSTFGYTRYSYTCPTRQFARQLNADTWAEPPSRSARKAYSTPRNSHHYTHHDIHNQEHSHAPASAHQETDPLLAAYISLLRARVPCHWRYADRDAQASPKKRSSVIEREIWVFWLNDQSLLQDHGLEKLKECQSGIMAWDSILQSNTPISVGSPQTPRPSAPSAAAASEPLISSQEYEILICGLRNVLDRGMVAKGGYRLGSSYVFPTSLQPRLDGSILPDFPKMPSMSMLSCTVTMYLSSSNLIFQPTFQYHRLRTLDATDVDPRQAPETDLPVILSPHATPAVLKLREMSDFSDEQTQKRLDGWANIFGTNQDVVDEMAASLPRLVTVSIMCGQNEVLLQYPSERVFVPVSCKDSPSDVGQLNGMGSRNLGFIEDLGAKFAMWSWQEKTRNAITSPAVPKLVQPVSEHTPVLAEPRNRLKAGSSAWQQQQHQLKEQQLQQLQHQQQQQQQQAFFLQQQQDALLRRATSDTNRIDYWSYTDPHAYLTSIVLNSCANVEPKGADSPSAADSQTSAIVPTISNRLGNLRMASTAKASGSAEADGWIRKKPKRNTVTSPKFNNLGSVEPPDTAQSAWNNGLDSASMQASDIEPSFNNTPQFIGSNSNNNDGNTKIDSAQVDIQNATVAASSTSYQLPIDLPNDSSDMMSGLMDMSSMLGLYGAGGSDDLGEVTNDDFSFFDDQPRSIPPPRSLPMAASSVFGTQSIQSSIPITSAVSSILPGTSAIDSTNGLMNAFSDMGDPFGKLMTTSPLNDDSLFANMELDLASFTQPTPPSSTILPLGTSDKLIVIPSGTMTTSPAGDHFVTSQFPQDFGILTPAPQASLSDHELNHHPQQHQSTPLPLHLATSEQSLVKRPSIFVEHMHSPIQSYIPSSFSPLKIVGDYFVDDSKYQAGGRYVYKRLYKRRRSSVLSPHNQYRKESRMLPFYQPGKDQEWIVPMRKERPRKPKSRVLSLGISWNQAQTAGSQPRIKSDSTVIKHEGDDTNNQATGSIPFTTVTGWRTSSLSPQQPEKRKKGDESSSGESDSDSSSSSSTGDSDDDGSLEPTQPTFGKLSRRFNAANMSTTDKTEPWIARGIDSARFVDALLAQPTDRSVGGALLGLKPLATSPTRSSASAARITEVDSKNCRTKSWPSAEAYHAEVEFDTPFTPAIMSAAPPALVAEPLAVQDSLASEYFLEAVKTLCEQAVMGDYPFAASNEVTGTSGEISEGESFHLMLARRKTMSEFLHAGVTTVPALGDESFRNMMEMKTVIFELFDHLRGNQSDNVVALPVPSDASQDMAMSMSTIHRHHHHSSQSNITPPVVMRGPLTLFQYFSLAEAQQMPSKYGKYQVKKKKPAEPALVQLQPPDIIVGHNEEWLEASPTILRFWEKLSLEPYSSKKNISYFVVYPEGADMESSVSKFWRELSVIFETSLLGKHQPGSLPDYKTGLVPIPLLQAMVGESREARQVRSYIDGCQRLGSILGGISMRRDVHTVIYMVNPFTHGAGYFDLCRCFSIMKTQFRTAAMGSLLTPLEQQRERLVMQMVPIQHVIYPSSFGGYLRFGLKDIAFTVYTKCKAFLERPTYSRDMMAQINSYAPSFALAKTTPATIHFEVSQKPNSVPKPPATLHVGYGFSLDRRWLVCVWTDHRGEMLEHMALDMLDCSNRVMLTGPSNSSSSNSDRPLTSCLQEIWTRTQVYQKRGSFSWKTVVCKLGLMTRLELQEWTRLTSGTSHTAIVAVNIDSPLRMYPHSRGAEYLSSGMTPNTSGINTPTNTGHGQTGTPLAGNTSIASTPLSQSMGPNVTMSSTMASTPDVSTAPTTPMSIGNAGSGAGLNSAGATGLGIAGASGTAGLNVGPQSGGSGGMGGIGGLSGSETLENSAGQVYAMMLNHRVPLIISREDAGLGASEGQADVNDLKSSAADNGHGQRLKGEEGDSKSDPNMSDSLHSTPMLDLDQDQDVNMDMKVKLEEPYHQPRQEQPQPQLAGKNQDASSSSSPRGLPTTSANDVILPLSTGYLIQVPVQSNSVMREKHSLEALGIEVHLLHLQRTATMAAGSASTSATVTNTPVPGVSTGTLLSNFGSPSPYQQPYHLQRHNIASPSTPGQPYRTSTFSSSQYPGSPLMSSPSSTFIGGLPQQQQQQQGQADAGGTTVKATVAASTTREILKQFHALSYLSQAPVQTNCLPNHLVLVERLSRVLLLVQD